MAKTYSREFREKAKLALLYDSTPEREDSDRGYFEKEDTYNANENLVPSNQYKSNNYDWDDDDDDIFASISTQEILHEDVQKTCKEVKLDELAPSTSKFAAAAAAPRRNWRPLSLNPNFNGPINEQIAQGMIFLIFHYAFIIKIRDETIFKLIQNFLDLVPSNQYLYYTITIGMTMMMT
ncbi:uncharacterized protein ACN427_001288 [Glossina fuscipes fuscipes]